MPTYGKENFKESNVNYLNKDFTALKTSLMNYAKSYFPNTYRDFNETSPGMMLLEMNAYVGDVLSFYIDKQYQEMLLPLAEERRNIITMAKMFGYKVKPIVPAYVDLTFTSNVDALSSDVTKVDYSNASVFDEGITIESSTNSDIVFTTLEPIDFRITGSGDTNTPASSDDAGLTSTYTLSRTVKAVSATEKTISFKIGTPEKFKTLTIPDTNVIDIISCVDTNGQNWYEVDYLAQDKVPIETHYSNDSNRESAYVDLFGNQSSEPTPYSLTYITTTKRFTRETNLDNTTSLVFGNGVLKNGQMVDEGFIDMEQVGIIIPGQASNLNSAINPLLGDEYSTLGETPNQTTLTITYRVGGGVNSNVPSVDLTTGVTDITTLTPTIDGGARLSTVTNELPAHGGKDEEDTIEIKERAKAFFSTQNRCVTKEDYEARVMNIPSKFGSISKVYVTRGDVNNTLPILNSDTYLNFIGLVDQLPNQLSELASQIETVVGSILGPDIGNTEQFQNIQNILGTDLPIILGTRATQLEQGVNVFNETGLGDALFTAVNDTIDFLKLQEIGGVTGTNGLIPLLNMLAETLSSLRNSTLQETYPIEALQLQLDALRLNSSDVSGLPSIMSSIPESLNNFVNEVQQENFSELSTINIYALGYNNRKQLVGNKHFPSLGLPPTLTNNIKNYLQNFKLMTDVITINDGYIVNFGVVFDIISEKYADKQQVKLNCIQTIKDYFRIEKMQFNQPIFKSQLEYELMGVEGVRSIGHVTITQKDDFNSDSADADLTNATYTYNFSTDGEALIDRDGDGTLDGSFVDASLEENGGGGTTGYGYKYDFENALSADGTIVLPPNVATPTVFELKNPNTNIQGRVR